MASSASWPAEEVGREAMPDGSYVVTEALVNPPIGAFPFRVRLFNATKPQMMHMNSPASMAVMMALAMGGDALPMEPKARTKRSDTRSAAVSKRKLAKAQAKRQRRQMRNLRHR